MSEEIKRHRACLRKEMKRKNGICGLLVCSDNGYCDRTECDLFDAFQAILTLADDYLAVKGFPEEQPPHIVKARDVWAFGFNQALHLCRVAHLKEIEGLKQERDSYSDLYNQRFKEVGELKKELKALKGAKIGNSTIEAHNKSAPVHKDNVSSDTHMDDYVKILPLYDYMGMVNEIAQLKSQLKGFCFAPMQATKMPTEEEIGDWLWLKKPQNTLGSNCFDSPAFCGKLAKAIVALWNKPKTTDDILKKSSRKAKKGAKDYKNNPLAGNDPYTDPY